MALNTYSPTTASRRGTVLVSKAGLWKGRPEKTLIEGLKANAGRNNLGRITTRHQGGGHKKLYRIVDFKRNVDDIPAQVERIEYDPNRTAFIALISYENNVKSYILAPHGLKVGDTVLSGEKIDIKVGNCLPLIQIPVGTVVHNVEMNPGAGGKIARSAGTFVQIVGRESGYVLLRIASGEMRKVRSECRATIGSVSNPDQKNVKLGKAGRSRWMGVRPSVRGVAMNPIDHPHGGGEGRTSGGRHPCTPWGLATKGKKTRRNKSTSQYIVKRRK